MPFGAIGDPALFCIVSSCACSENVQQRRVQLCSSLYYLMLYFAQITVTECSVDLVIKSYLQSCQLCIVTKQILW